MDYRGKFVFSLQKTELGYFSLQIYLFSLFPVMFNFSCSSSLRPPVMFKLICAKTCSMSLIIFSSRKIIFAFKIQTNIINTFCAYFQTFWLMLLRWVCTDKEISPSSNNSRCVFICLYRYIFPVPINTHITAKN